MVTLSSSPTVMDSIRTPWEASRSAMSRFPTEWKKTMLISIVATAETSKQ